MYKVILLFALVKSVYIAMYSSLHLTHLHTHTHAHTRTHTHTCVMTFTVKKACYTYIITVEHMYNSVLHCFTSVNTSGMLPLYNMCM